MERDREIAKLIDVLRRIARASRHAAWTRDLEAARFCVIQYNKMLSRVSELEPAVVPLFTSLPENTSAEVIRIAADELAAYFDDEAASDFPLGIGIGFRTRGCGGRRAWAGRVRLGSCW